jgi:hypothetical protein
MKRLFNFFSVLTFTTSVMASVIGSEISYRPLYADSTVYEIQIKLYRDCRGLKLDNINSSTSIRCAGGSTSTNLSPTLVSVREITSYSGNTGNCNPPNSNMTGPGVEEIIFKDTVDFSTSPFSSYASCNEVLIEYGTCCRNSNINTGAANTTYYNNASLFLGNFKQNTSTVFQSHPLLSAPINLPIHYVNRVKESDGDSISYRMIAPQTNATSSASFTGGLAADMPVNVFFFGSFAYPYSNPNFSPPIGFYFDGKTGDMVFTPTTANQISSYTIEATEWRKDTSGTFKKAGIVKHDMRLVTQLITNNNYPEFEDLSTLKFACNGEENTLQIEVTDRRLVPPPPANPPDYDTLDLDVFCDYPVRVSIDSQKFANNTSTLWATVSWNTDSFNAVPNQFDIVLKAYESNRFTSYNYETRRVRVLNYPRPRITKNIRAIGCGYYEIEVSSDTFQNAEANINFQVYNENQQLVYSRLLASSQRKDTFRVATSGKYYTEIIGNFALACSSTILDSFEVASNEIYPIPTETDLLICYQDSTALTIDPIWKEGRWSTGDTAKQLIVKQDGMYTVELVDSCNNTFEHSFNVRFRTIEPFIQDTAICSGDNAVFTAILPPQASIAWPDNSTRPDYATSTPGDYIATITDSLCNVIIEDSFSIARLTRPIVNILQDSTFVCEDSTTVLTAQLQNFDAVAWNTGSDSASTVVSSPGFYIATANNGCGSTRDTIRVIGKKLPAINLGEDEVRCKGDSIEISIVPEDYNFIWSTGDTTTTIQTKTEQQLVLTATNFCGSVNDTIGAYFVDTPAVDLGPDIAKEEFALVTLRNQTPSRFATYLWNIGSNADSLQVRLAGDYWLQETNACGTDSDTINVRYTVGIKDLEDRGFKLYPNPASDFFTIYAESAELVTYTLYDATGKAVLPTQTFVNQLRVETSNLPAGIYRVILTQDQKQVVSTIIVQ